MFFFAGTQIFLHREVTAQNILSISSIKDEHADNSARTRLSYTPLKYYAEVCDKNRKIPNFQPIPDNNYSE